MGSILGFWQLVALWEELPDASTVKHLLAVQEMQEQVQSLGGEDSLGGNGNLLKYSCLEKIL